jgi:hypothetical protein
LISVPDKAQLGAFANGLRAAMVATGVEAPPVVEGMGFWNRPAGLALGIAFVASLAIAGHCPLGTVGRSERA